jgi:hypothetical protein
VLAFPVGEEEQVLAPVDVAVVEAVDAAGGGAAGCGRGRLVNRVDAGAIGWGRGSLGEGDVCFAIYRHVCNTSAEK